MEGTKVFESVHYMTESTRECQKAKKFGTEISTLGAFVASSKLFFTILNWELRFALSQIPSRPVSAFEPSLNLSRPAKNLSRHNSIQHTTSPDYFNECIIVYTFVLTL